MKISILFLLFSASSVLGRDINPVPDKLWYGFRSYSFDEKDRNLRFKVFRNENLHLIKKENLAAYTNLEYAIIIIELPPMAPDSEKEKALSVFEKNMPYLKELLQCPGLKGIIFQVASYILIREKEKGLSYNNHDRETTLKAYRVNSERFDERFGKKLKKLLPGIKLYFHNAGW